MTRSLPLLGLVALGTLMAPASHAESAPPERGPGFFARLGEVVLNPNGRARPRKEDSAAPVMTDAEFADVPDWFRSASVDHSSNFRVVKGRLSATQDRARADARRALDQAVADWLKPEVAGRWRAPKAEVDALIRRSHVEPIARKPGMPAVDEYPVVYLAGYEVNLDPQVRAGLVDRYQQELVARRLGVLGSLLALALIGLAALSAYIRADEATKGYYTNRLRLLTVAGVGAAGYVFYRLVS